jgi:hypothetical protein
MPQANGMAMHTDASAVAEVVASHSVTKLTVRCTTAGGTLDCTKCTSFGMPAAAVHNTTRNAVCLA